MTGNHQPITRTTGAAFGPAPSPDGRVFFMGLEPDGFVVRVVDGHTTAPPAPAYDRALVPALPPIIAAPLPFTSQTLPAPRPYGIGRQESGWLIGETLAPNQSELMAGVRIGDVIGRLDTLIMGSIARRNGQRGAGVATAWRGWPVAVAAHLFTADDRFVKRNGLELRGSWTAQRPLSTFSIEAGGLTGKPLDIGFADASFRQRQIISNWHAEEEVRVSGEEGDSLRHYRGVVRASLRSGAFSLAGQYQHDGARSGNAIDVGGVDSSILPRSAIPNRVFDPALPIATLAGGRYDGVRFEAKIPIIPATMFYQRHRIGTTRLALAGLELSLLSDVNPLLRLPGLDVTAGVARILAEPLRNRTKGWLAIRWRP